MYKMVFELYFLLLSVGIVEGASIIQECIRSNGGDYRGEQLSTSSGQECLNWITVTRDFNLTAYTDVQSGVGDHNYCRNPDSSDRPWCYVASENGTVQKQDCDISACGDYVTAEPASPPASSTGAPEVFEPAQSEPAQNDNAAVQPVIGIRQRVQTGAKKKDLGTLGYVLGILMMAVIILLGVGITFGYIYKRGRDLQRQREQRAYEREMQRITLPLSAFSNPACEVTEENAVVVSGDQQTPCQEGGVAEGGTPLIGQAGTPGA
ncbi:phosphoinositide-3-kinase-interacting protein 1 [Brienomyrus brachyistius]|uniref:phosphoinositide-3-kinase-interacting protein 1 n=1 Tax=Brienomyrus brachyistius TaxID=42636 RepID=UPI0020B44265|nr:phosphoinositide-3-kinase-interacting protein 1 [Brienomyrus brachyistius]